MCNVCRSKASWTGWDIISYQFDCLGHRPVVYGASYQILTKKLRKWEFEDKEMHIKMIN